MILRYVREVKALVDAANAIMAEADATGRPRFSLFLSNRSFVAQVVSVISGVLLAAFGFVVPGDPALWVDVILLVGLVGGQLWSLAERLMGNTKTVWNHKQAIEAVGEADALKKALEQAGAPTG